MAKIKNDKDKTASGDLNNNKNNTLNSSEEEGLFDENNSPQDEELFEEIKSSLAAGDYREKAPSPAPQEEDEPAPLSNLESVELKNSGNKAKGNTKKKAKKGKKPAEKTTLLHKLKVISILLVLGIFTGSGLGVWYFNVNLRSKTNYDKYVVAEYQGDVKEVLSSNFGLESASKDWLSQVRENSPDASPDDLTAVDNFILASYKAKCADAYVIIGNGQSEAIGVKQSVYSRKLHMGNKYSFEAISKGTGRIGLEIAILDMFEKNTRTNAIESVDIYRGENITRRNATWRYNKTVTPEKYYDLTGYDVSGSLPNTISTYIISDKTVTSCTSSYDEQTGLYTYTYQLNPVTGALLYYKEMRRTGELEGDPEFVTIKYTMTIDKDWNLVTTRADESYYAIRFGAKPKCTGYVENQYKFGQEALADIEFPTVKGK